MEDRGGAGRHTHVCGRVTRGLGGACAVRPCVRPCGHLLAVPCRVRQGVCRPRCAVQGWRASGIQRLRRGPQPIPTLPPAGSWSHTLTPHPTPPVCKRNASAATACCACVVRPAAMPDRAPEETWPASTPMPGRSNAGGAFEAPIGTATPPHTPPHTPPPHLAEEDHDPGNPLYDEDVGPREDVHERGTPPALHPRLHPPLHLLGRTPRGLHRVLRRPARGLHGAHRARRGGAPGLMGPAFCPCCPAL